MSSRPILQAHPRTPDEVASLSSCPEVVQAAEARGIKDVVHFTTIKGAVGVLAAGAVKSRQRLPKEKYLQHVYQPNVDIRKDPAWLDYVNLSISRINDWMFDTSVKWHSQDNNSWVVFAFAPRLLGDPGVVFATTNNIYPKCQRAEGVDGFEGLFADSVIGRTWPKVEQHDRVGKPPDCPTDRQAEVLYPGEVPCRYLHRIDVQQEDTIDEMCGTLAGLGLSVPVRHAPEVFE